MEEKEAVDVGMMPGLQEESHVVDYRVLAASPSPRFFPGMVVDFTYLEHEFDDEEVVEIEDPWTGAGDKAAADLPELAVAEDGKVMELVAQEYIRVLLKSPPRTRTKPLLDCSIEALRRKGIREEGIEILASSCRNSQLRRDIQNHIIQQYLVKGYAYVELPLASKRYPATPTELLPPLP